MEESNWRGACTTWIAEQQKEKEQEKKKKTLSSYSERSYPRRHIN